MKHQLQKTFYTLINIVLRELQISTKKKTTCLMNMIEMGVLLMNVVELSFSLYNIYITLSYID